MKSFVAFKSDYMASLSREEPLWYCLTALLRNHRKPQGKEIEKAKRLISNRHDYSQATSVF